MAKRKRKVIPFPTGAASSKPLETKPLSDADKLQWQKFLGPAEQCVAAVQVAINNSANVLAERMMRDAGLDPEDGWQFNKDKLRWERRAVPAEE